ncbi:aa3-type cytochrome oxidase subunit CtaJ [Geodermatophilus marinus]|uniref:aa3-type cytochrome oxidase subunit CtaJ n=1 Tax=Geodermatophilus sp. LHW52908 TaxID=2303986 RepID=UPI0018F6FD28|nr:hypothetical protein [Geodermatophilus sp. LHW52908]
MTVVETLLVFVVAPLAVILIFWALVYLPGGRRRKLRYKPGQAWEHEPVWYEPHPAGGAGGGHGTGPAAVPGSGTSALGSSMYPEQRPELEAGDGQARAAGATAVGAGGQAVVGGPLGGARGTW